MTGRTTGQCLPYSLTARGWWPISLDPTAFGLGRAIRIKVRGIPMVRGEDRSLLGGWAPDHLDEIVEPELAGKGGLYLIGVELKVLLCRHDWLIQGQTDYRPAQ
jgi:hypothetical protein